MSDENSSFIPRLPRHAVATEHRLAVTFHALSGQRGSDPGDADSAVAIALINLSRCGLQFRSPTLLASGDRLAIQFVDPESDFQLRQEAVVRWQRSEADLSWLTGCQFLEELSWEVLGEFFLSDVLTGDVVSPRPA